MKKARWLQTPLGTAYLVDGPAVRAKHVDFIGGGHHWVYSWLPAGQIWIERSTNQEQRLLLAHELVEVLAMKYLKVDYDRGHEIANGVEKSLRGLSVLAGARSGRSGARSALRRKTGLIAAQGVFLRHLSARYPKGHHRARKALARRLGALATGK